MGWFRRLDPAPRGLQSGHIGNIESMHITNGTVSADVEYTEHEDGTWSFNLDVPPRMIQSRLRVSIISRPRNSRRNR